MAFSCILALCALVSQAHAAPSHPFSVHDLVAIQRITEFCVSPDGARVAFTLRTTDLEANKGTTDLWLVRSDGTGLRRLTTHPGADRAPCWSPDSRSVLFLSDRGGSSQVWRIAADGGEAQPVTHLALDVACFRLSPDGRWLALAVELYPGASVAETRRRLDEASKRKSTGRLYDRALMRHWDTWRDGRRSHLVVLPATGQGEPIDVMGSMDADCPSKPFRGPEEFTFTPDSAELVFSARDAGPAEAWSTDFDLYRVPRDGSRRPTSLTESNPAWDTRPCFSPDGKYLAYLAMQRPGYESDRFRIVLWRWPDGPAQILTEGWDRSPEEIAWSSDGRILWATAANLGQHSLFAVDPATGQLRTVVHSGDLRMPAACREGAVVSLCHLRWPAELFWVSPDGETLRPLTAINRQRLAGVRMGDFEQFTFAGHNGDTVYAMVVKPVDCDPRKKYPVAFLIHGGPQGSFGNTFHYRWNPQVYAGAGYAAVMVDFHGSVGYGQAFTDSIRGDWGGKPLEDLQKGLEAALHRYPWLDGQRVAALGASYGGYMVNWIAGAWPDRFRCLVNHDGNLDLRMAYFDTDELWFPEWDHQGTPWSNPQGYEEHNPVRLVHRWKTPMLVIHGGRDYRIPESQAIGTFNALQRRGIPSKFLYFPDENHWVLSPQNSILWHQTVLDWLDQWLRK